MKIVSWNVNGLRACLGKGFLDAALSLEADAICLQETKMERGQADVGLDRHGYKEFWSSAQKKGYSGTAVFTRAEPLRASFGIGMPEHDSEGRVIRLEFERFALVNVYVPNSRDELARLPYRMRWEDDFRAYLLAEAGRSGKPVVVCGDMNVAHQEIDLKNPKTNRRNAGFTDEERAKMGELLDAGFADAFRRLHPDARGAYTWWSYLMRARDRNAGWRIDYFLVSERLMQSVTDASIHPGILGSDHCPISLTLSI